MFNYLLSPMQYQPNTVGGFLSFPSSHDILFCALPQICIAVTYLCPLKNCYILESNDYVFFISPDFLQ